MNKIALSIAIYSITLIICLILIKRTNKGFFDLFDPGFLFLIFVTLTFIPLTILVFQEDGIQHRIFRYFYVADLNLFSKTINAHTILIVSFTSVYYMFVRRIRETKNYHDSKVWYSNIWIHIGICFAIFDLATSSLQLSGLICYPFTLIQWIAPISMGIAVGVIACKFDTRIKVFAFLIVFGISYMLFTNLVLHHGEPGGINRGSTFSLVLMAICYVNMTKWKGQLLRVWTFLILVLLGLTGLSLAEVFESIVLFGDPFTSLKTVLINISLAFEPMLFDNAGTIISWVDTGSAKLREGDAYLQAFEGFIPVGYKYQSLSEWYVWKRNPGYAETGGGYGFSAVAEGYLNFKFFGVVIQGFILSIFAVILRGFRNSKLLGVYHPFFYSPCILLVLVFNRKELKGLFGTITLTLFSVVSIVIIYSMLKCIFKTKPV
jgi:hypothetical protein